MEIKEYEGVKVSYQETNRGKRYLVYDIVSGKLLKVVKEKDLDKHPEVKRAIEADEGDEETGFDLG